MHKFKKISSKNIIEYSKNKKWHKIIKQNTA